MTSPQDVAIVVSWKQTSRLAQIHLPVHTNYILRDNVYAVAGFDQRKGMRAGRYALSGTVGFAFNAATVLAEVIVLCAAHLKVRASDLRVRVVIPPYDHVVKKSTRFWTGVVTKAAEIEFVAQQKVAFKELDKEARGRIRQVESAEAAIASWSEQVEKAPARLASLKKELKSVKDYLRRSGRARHPDHDLVRERGFAVVAIPFSIKELVDFLARVDADIAEKRTDIDSNIAAIEQLAANIEALETAQFVAEDYSVEEYDSLV